MKKKTGRGENKGALRLPADMGPAKSYLAFWCLQDERLGKYQDKFAEILKKAIMDADFKGRLLANTAAVLKENGINLGASLTIKVVDNSYDTIHLMIPRIQAVASSGCIAELKDGDLLSRADKAHCFDDFDAGDWGRYNSDSKDKGDAHTAD